MKKRGAKQLSAMAEYLGSHDLQTGAQLRGPVWTGPKPMKGTHSRGYTPEYAEANAAIEEKRHPQMAFMPDSGLGKILLDPRVKRSLRRAILTVVQAKPTPARDRLERRVERELTALGISPS